MNANEALAERFAEHRSLTVPHRRAFQVRARILGLRSGDLVGRGFG
jgi:hypothetical protein